MPAKLPYLSAVQPGSLSCCTVSRSRTCYSIREPQVIDLRVAANVPDVPGRFAPVWLGSEERAPKTIAIFGANASGKSTVLKIVCLSGQLPHALVRGAADAADYVRPL